MTEELAARLQFATAAITHGLFAATTIGLITVIAVLQTLAYRRRDPSLLAVVRAWAAPYVVIYVCGIAAGMILELQFGLSWAGLVDRAGNVVGAPLTVEVLTTFIAESTLLALWTFGWGVIGPRLHLALVWGAAATAVLSVFWSLAANSFLQHPRGFSLVGDTVVLTDLPALLTGAPVWMALIHVVGASLMVGGALVAGVGAVGLRAQPDQIPPKYAAHRDVAAPADPQVPLMLSVLSVRWGTTIAGGGGVVAVIAGFQSLTYLRDTQPGKALILGQGSLARSAVVAELQRRYGEGSWLPPAWLLVPALLMVLIGFVVTGLAVWVVAGGEEGRPRHTSPVMRLLPWAAVVTYLAVVCGWLVREVGRQPWVVYGLLRTSEAVTPVGPTRSWTTLVVVAVACLATAVVAVVLAHRVGLLAQQRIAESFDASARVRQTPSPEAAGPPDTESQGHPSRHDTQVW